MTIAIKANPDGISGAVQVNGVDAVPFTANGVSTAGIAPLAVTPEKLSQKITLGTSVATTSGTAIDFIGIPSWVKKVTIIFDSISTNGTSIPVIQLGDSGGFETTGYTGSAWYHNTTSLSASGTSTNGFDLTSTWAAAGEYSGIMDLVNISGNIWVEKCSIEGLGGVGGGSGARKELTSTLTQIRLTTAGGANTFDAGSVNIMWE